MFFREIQIYRIRRVPYMKNRFREVRHSLYLQIHSNHLLSHRDIRFCPFLIVCRRHFLKLRHAPLI